MLRLPISLPQQLRFIEKCYDAASTSSTALRPTKSVARENGSSSKIVLLHIDGMFISWLRALTTPVRRPLYYTMFLCIN